ncbi:TPA: hypothetical protein EYP12_05045, partial [Candidatus Bipolaricaulota bacterium]|nr:hypothetical protein [Candidatus Bipolaricaulota bacterium]
MSAIVSARVKESFLEILKQVAENKGYASVSDFVRDVLDKALKEGTMVDERTYVEFMKEVESLKRAGLELEHRLSRDRESFEDSLKELRRAVDDLKERLGSEVRSVKNEVASLAGDAVKRSSFREILEDICKRDPDSPFCRIAREEARKAAKDLLAEKERNEIVIEHASWQDVFSCPECKSELLEKVLRYARE